MLSLFIPKMVALSPFTLRGDKLFDDKDDEEEEGDQAAIFEVYYRPRTVTRLKCTPTLATPTRT